MAFQYPELAAQWHPTKNGSLLPSQVFPCSDRIVWWTCNHSPSIDLFSDQIIELQSMRDEEIAKVRKQQGCGRDWEERIVNRVTKYKSNLTLGTFVVYRSNNR